MDWREAFFYQARSDYRILMQLAQANVEYAHQLHYLQMVTEKLAKGWLSTTGSMNPPQTVHKAFVGMLHAVKNQPQILRQLGYGTNRKACRSFITSLLPLAAKIENLAPTSDLSKPNPEYPWKNLSTGQITAPASFTFAEFDPKHGKMRQLTKLIKELLTLG